MNQKLLWASMELTPLRIWASTDATAPLAQLLAVLLYSLHLAVIGVIRRKIIEYSAEHNYN